MQFPSIRPIIMINC